jgi:hypothetical protein
MRYILICLILILPNYIKAQCLDSLKTVFIIEEMPSCLDCNIKIENKLRQNIGLVNFDNIDTISVCYEINTQGGIQNVVTHGVNNSQLTALIYDALSSGISYMPAKQGGRPIVCPMFLGLILDHNNGTSTIKTVIQNIPSKTEVEFITEKHNQEWREYFKNNSKEKINRVSIWVIEQYIFENLSKRKGYMSSFSKDRKTKRLVVETSGDEFVAMLLIPQIKYKLDLFKQNDSKLFFGEIPIGCEVILIITKEIDGRVEICLEKFTFNGSKDVPNQFKEFTYEELNKRINELKFK